MNGSHSFPFANKVVAAIVPQTVNAAGTANGATILEPWQYGRSIAFILQAGSLNSVTVFGVKVQRRLRSDGSTWSDVPNVDGNDLEFPAAQTIDGTALENGAIVGSMPLDRFDGVTYDALRLVVHTVTGGNIPLAALAVIYNLHNEPSGQTDQLLELSTAVSI